MTLKKKILIAAVFVVVAVICAAALIYWGVIPLNRPDEKTYPVRGVDVSSYQGDIDWKTLCAQGIDFAFIKATEGSSFVDPRFAVNWQNAAQTDLRIGGYHFFSFESSGARQADLFCATVTPVEGMLPPVIDVEFYGDFSKDNVDLPTVREQLRVMIDRLTDHYGVKPILYATEDSRKMILGDAFDDCDLWARSVYRTVGDDVPWTFWQYSNRARLAGYDGKEPYIDMNVFRGDEAAFARYPEK